MECPNCQKSNPEGAKFCMRCGARMVAVCQNCQTENPAEAKFCFNCGRSLGEGGAPAATEERSPLERFVPKEFAAKLEQARSSQAMEGERRVVTMLFCDVKGSTAAAEQLDPEEWAEIINGAFEHMIGPVYQYEGTVARLMGDAILAFFGAPIAHEDDPQRSILAGLSILKSIEPYRREVKERWGVEIDVRIGINTGLVVVGAVGSDLRMEYTALGDAINLAARMEQTAAPGSVQISENTHKLVAPLFEFDDLGGIEVKGKELPVRAYRVIGRKAEPERLRGVEGLESRLIGRDGEMHTLRGAIIDLRQGRGGIISVIGEAGLGKSRLMVELRRAPTPIAGADAPLRWLEGRSLSYETSTPYAPFVGTLTDCFGLQGEQEDEDKYERMRAAVLEIAGDSASEIVPYLASLLEIKPAAADLERVRFLEPPQLRQRVFAAVLELVERMAMDRPTVLILDDIHWIDRTSFDLLQQLLPLTDRVPLLILALFRPRRDEISWQFHEGAARDYAHRYQAISLRPLDQDSSRELVSSLLEIDDLPEAVRQAILAKAEGNPFFMEEVIRSLLDQGLVVREDGTWRATREIENISVPDTLAAVITTRLDRLDADSKHLIQTASVIGREFLHETLARTAGDFEPLDRALSNLQRRQLVLEKSRLPQWEYMFKHALTQETAYGSLLLKRRRQLHQLVAESLEETRPEKVADIGRHLLEAGLPGRALPYLVKAGDRAAASYATPEAIGFYEKALEVVKESGDISLARQTYEGLGGALTFANDVPRAMETYQEMLKLADERGDIPMQVSALNKMSFISALRMGQFNEAERYLLEADKRARQEQDKVGLSEMSIIRCMMCTAAADFEGVVHYMGETVSLAQELDVPEQIALGLAHISSSQVYMLQFDQAWQSIRKGLSVAREIGDREHEAELLVTSSLIHMCTGDIRAAYQSAEKGLKIALRIGSIPVETLGARMRGVIAHWRGAYEEAIGCYQHYLDAGRKMGAVWAEAEALCQLGTVYLEINPSHLNRVIEYHDQASQVMELPAGTMLGGTAWAELGYCNLKVNKLDKAAELFQKGLEQPTITTNLERPRLLTGYALVALERGEVEQSNSTLKEAETMAREQGLKLHLPRIELARARLSLARNETDEALDCFERAEKMAMAIGMLPLVWQAQAGAAEHLQNLGRELEATKKRQLAGAIVDHIASFFRDESLRESFLMNASLTLSA